MGLEKEGVEARRAENRLRCFASEAVHHDPSPWSDANERVKARQLLVTKMLANPPQMFKSRQLKKAVEMGIIQDSVMDNAALATARLLGGDSEEEPEAFGWNLQAPSAQSMTRDGAKLAPPDWDVLHGELEEAVGQPLRRSWSVAF